MIRITLPDVKYKTTYIEAVKEFLKNGSDNESTDRYIKKDLDDLTKNFEKYVNKLIDAHKGINLDNGKVPSSQYWIIDENEKYCGRISLRHHLNDALSKHGGHIGYDIIPSERGKKYASKALELCLREAKKIGLNEVLLTCDDDNIPSIKTIERNGGILQDKLDTNNKIRRRYIIKI